jgi:glycosyltransferase involved in cell wall biosynthesis
VRDHHTGGWLKRLFGKNRGAARNSSEPLVSVVIATYNWSSVLRLAIATVLWQTMQDFELLVIGDGCTDDSAQVAQSFGDPRIRWHNLPGNSGNQSEPNNAGLAMARGRYVAYLGHDDVWHPTHLARLVGALRRTGAELAYTQCVMLGPPGSHIRLLTGISQYREGQGIPPSSIMHVRAMAAEIGGWRDFRKMELPPDLEFVLRAFQAGQRFTAVDALTVFKFNSALRPNSYREKPCHEQAEYIRRIRSERNFIRNERRAIEADAALGAPFRVPGMPEPPNPLPPGWTVTQWRRIRGLEP